MGRPGPLTGAPDAPRRAVRRRALRWGATAAAGVVALCGCSVEQWQRAGLPPPASEQTAESAGQFWVWAWVAALCVGAIVWGLILWSAFRYRAKSADLPPQTRYNIPIEALYTIAPFIIIASLFYWEFVTEPKVKQTSGDASVRIDVIGQKWAWTFNYVDERVYDQGISSASGTTQLPTLWLPVGERVRFHLGSPDVIHSFWVPSFYFKMDVIPGKGDQVFFITPSALGTYRGFCAELCGTYHSAMRFTVKIVDRDAYDQHIRDLRRAGQTGYINVDSAAYDSGQGGGATVNRPPVTEGSGNP